MVKNIHVVDFFIEVQSRVAFGVCRLNDVSYYSSKPNKMYFDGKVLIIYVNNEIFITEFDYDQWNYEYNYCQSAV